MFHILLYFLNIMYMKTIVFNNKYILYFILILVIGDVYSLAMSEKYEIIAVYGAIGFLTTWFSKNMMVVLVIAMATANILRLTNVFANIV